MINGSFKLFRLFGIDVFLHWSWFLVAVFLIPRFGDDAFTGPGNTAMLWSAGLYLTLFAIVLTHEFGHALACKQVGGQARHIVLWPLGGVAYVQPPHRPGAHLWSIVAGPLVNVMLVPVTVMAYYLMTGGLDRPIESSSNLHMFAFSVMWMNFALLIFNMLPVYPLDGGQTLMALLWFVVGRVKALKFVSTVGLTAAGAVVLLAVFNQNWWFMVLALFVGMQAWNGYRLATALAQMDPKMYDERVADRSTQDDMEQRIADQIDPWRR